MKRVTFGTDFKHIFHCVLTRAVEAQGPCGHIIYDEPWRSEAHLFCYFREAKSQTLDTDAGKRTDRDSGREQYSFLADLIFNQVEHALCY